MIDHAWTYRANDARRMLSESELLLNRMANLMNVTVSEDDLGEENIGQEMIERKIGVVLENMWKFNQTYKLSTEQLVGLKS